MTEITEIQLKHWEAEIKRLKQKAKNYPNAAALDLSLMANAVLPICFARIRELSVKNKRNDKLKRKVHESGSTKDMAATTMTDFDGESARDLIIGLRGGVPRKCDFCLKETPEHDLHPEEGGDWACITCMKRWRLAEEKWKRGGRP